MEFNKGYGSSTHQPMIKAVLDLYKPRFIFELGVGIYSTPLFLAQVNDNPNHKVMYRGIENDPEWIAYIEEQYDIPSWISHHNIGWIKKSIPYGELTVAQWEEISSFYYNLNLPSIRPSLLFIDNYASCRVIALNALRDKFDIIIFHDCEPNAVSWYGWDSLDKGSYKPFYLTSYESWTGLLVKDDLGYNALDNALKPHIEDYEHEMGDVNMKLINDDNHI